jgi:uncharacterized protein
MPDTAKDHFQQLGEEHESSTELSEGTPPPSSLPEETPREKQHWASAIFIGANGLRAGWRLLIFAGLFLAIGVALGWLLLARSAVPLWSATARLEAVLFISALIASKVMGHFEKRSLADFGLPSRSMFGARFWEGGVWGFAAISVLLLVLHALGDFDYGTTALTAMSAIKYAGLWGAVFLLVGFAEEYTFRGYPLFTLGTGMGFWPSVLLMSVLFGSVHLGNMGETAMGALLAGFIGLFFCLTLRRTGALWFAIGAHAGWDWGQTFVYGVPDSGEVAGGHLLNPSFHGSKWITGGTVGPEGSVLALVVVAAMMVVAHFRFREIHQPEI